MCSCVDLTSVIGWVLILVKRVYRELDARVSYELMGLIVFRESVQAEDGEDVHVLIIDHKTNVTETASSLKGVFLYLPPQDEIDEDFCNFFQRLEVYVLGSQTTDDYGVEALLINNFLKVLLILTKQGEALASQLLEDLVFLLHKE